MRVTLLGSPPDLQTVFQHSFWLFGLIGLLGTTVSAMMAFGIISELR